jgi:acetyltransferase-like isoleucine patch superfamily enzyme
MEIITMKGMDIGKIHSTAIVSDKAKIGENVTIGVNVIIYDNVEIGDNVLIGPNSVIGEPLAAYYKDRDYSNPRLTIGSESIIRTGAIIYAGSTIGRGFECGHRVTIREETKIGQHTRVGTLSDVQGYCEIGNYVRIHSNVHVGQKSFIGNFVWIFPYAVLANDPHPPSNVLVGVTIEDFAVIAVKAVVLPGVRIGRDAMIGAMALVNSDVPPEAVMCGNPAKQITTIRDIKSKYTEEPPYPWREHFERGMPWEGIGYNEWRRSRREKDNI